MFARKKECKQNNEYNYTDHLTGKKMGKSLYPFFLKVLNAYLALEEPFFYEVWNLEIFIRV